jgi:hypothetical protein
MKWVQKEAANEPFESHLPLYIQYFTMLSTCTIEFLGFHLVIRTTLDFFKKQTLAELNRLSMALVLSSFGKLLLIVMVIWDYGNLNPSIIINMFVFLCNYVCLLVTLDLSRFTTFFILLAGELARSAIYLIKS